MKHPRTRKRFVEFGMNEWISSIRRLSVINPLGYLEFLAFLQCSKFVMTDSGGIQEEACILNVPCITLRENTERPETIPAGANIVAGTTKHGIISALSNLKEKKQWQKAQEKM